MSTFGDNDFRASTQAPQLRPLAPERFALQFTIGKETYETLRDVQALLSHQVPSGDVVQVFDRALKALKAQLEKQKFAGTAAPRPRSPRHHSGANRSRFPRPPANRRYIPARVKRAVWARDGGRCTFVNASGERCRAHRMLEFDHIDPVARGGRATVDGVRLLCRGHNQHEADRRFGAGFMNEKREKSRRATAAAPPIDSAATVAQVRAPTERVPARSAAVPDEQIPDLMAGLVALGFRAREARRAIESGGALRDATLEERMRAALRFLCPVPG